MGRRRRGTLGFLYKHKGLSVCVSLPNSQLVERHLTHSTPSRSHHHNSLFHSFPVLFYYISFSPNPSNLFIPLSPKSQSIHLSLSPLIPIP